jgi:hypothetical protein
LELGIRENLEFGIRNQELGIGENWREFRI